MAVYTIKIPHGGIYEAFIDGVSQGKNDTYNPSTAQYNQKTFEKTGLSDGEHTIKLVVTGDANPSATGSKVGYVGLDYFLVSGGDGAAPASAATTPAAPATSGATTVAGGFSAEGSWQSSSLAGFIAANKTYYTNTKGAVAQWNPGVTEAASVTVSVYKLAHDSSIVQEYEIYHNGKVDKKSVNFKEGSSGWAELGTFDFAGKGDEYLKLTAAASSTRIAEAKFDVTSGANAGKSIVVAIDKQP
ncbi:hypothetical protein FACS189492_2640 [Clostridia bacterium]|nr:hypothetical protein FACS189492_2640 [Clostridia bacterium]